MTTVEEDRKQVRIDGLLDELRAAEADFRRSYARVLDGVAELEKERAGAVAGFGTMARLLAGVLNLSQGEGKARAEQAGLLAARRSLTGEVLPPTLPATAAELAAGTIGPAQVPDALVEAMSCLLDEGELPARGGQRPHLVLTMRLTDLIEGLGSAVLDTGGQLSAAAARRLACDACIVPMVVGSDSMPLDVGRQQRLATAALRDALGHRDQGCSFPGCRRPPRYCHAHHIRSWLDGGETKLANHTAVRVRPAQYGVCGR
ncbi:MAG: DUF222 domain-containing protein [Pseudonocardiaceae bacterium]